MTGHWPVVNIDSLRTSQEQLNVYMRKKTIVLKSGKKTAYYWLLPQSHMFCMGLREIAYTEFIRTPSMLAATMLDIAYLLNNAWTIFIRWTVAIFSRYHDSF